MGVIGKGNLHFDVCIVITVYSCFFISKILWKYMGETNVNVIFIEVSKQKFN